MGHQTPRNTNDNKQYDQCVQKSSYWETTAFDSADASFIIKFFIPFITINMQVNVFYITIVKLRH